MSLSKYSSFSFNQNNGLEFFLHFFPSHPKYALVMRTARATYGVFKMRAIFLCLMFLFACSPEGPEIARPGITPQMATENYKRIAREQLARDKERESAQSLASPVNLDFLLREYKAKTADQIPRAVEDYYLLLKAAGYDVTITVHPRSSMNEEYFVYVVSGRKIQ